MPCLSVKVSIKKVLGKFYKFARNPVLICFDPCIKEGSALAGET